MEDVHTRTAARLFNKPAEEVTTEERRMARIIDFGTLYSGAIVADGKGDKAINKGKQKSRKGEKEKRSAEEKLRRSIQKFGDEAMTIHEVKRIHEEKFPDSHYFDRNTLRFFGQTLKSFSVCRDGELYIISAPLRMRQDDGKMHKVAVSSAVFDPVSGKISSIGRGE